MALTASCPQCRASLVLTNHDTFDSWICPNGHGLAATLSELYERAQEDEIHRLWQVARAAARARQAGDRPCPMCERPMVSIVVPTDADEAEEGAPGDTADTGSVPVDVCVADEVVWFDASELDAMPADLPDPQPTPEQEAALADITRRFGEEYEAAVEARAGFTEKVADRIRWSPTALGLFRKAPATN